MSYCEKCNIDHTKIHGNRECPLSTNKAVCFKCGNSPDWWTAMPLEMECHGKNYYCESCVGNLFKNDPFERPCKAEPLHCCGCNLSDVVLEDDPESDKKYCVRCTEYYIGRVCYVCGKRHLHENGCQQFSARFINGTHKYCTECSDLCRVEYIHCFACEKCHSVKDVCCSISS